MTIGNEVGNLTSYLSDEFCSSLWVTWDRNLTALLWYWESSALGFGHHQNAGKWSIQRCKLALLFCQSYKEVRLPEVRSLTHWRQLAFQVHGFQRRSMYLERAETWLYQNPCSVREEGCDRLAFHANWSKMVTWLRGLESCYEADQCGRKIYKLKHFWIWIACFSTCYSGIL